jgi:hypothetical protein
MKKLWLVVCGLFASVLVYFGLSRRDKSKQIEATKRESEEKDVALTDAHVELEVTNAVSTRSLITSCATVPVSQAEVAPTIDMDLSGLSAPYYDEEGSTCLPPDLAHELNVQRENARRMPERCQIRLDVLAERERRAKEGKWLDRLEFGVVGIAVGAVLTVIAFGLGGAR